ncbi:folliculin-interacting protein 1-like [Antedon mediterranea]|uniref:folliculin-interacting protein 1-like n=1 Tax=Antedon mediterranea TaxID=105859 RepID=UPI003AF7279F
MAKVLHRMFHRDRKCGFNAESPESLTSYKCWKPPDFDPKQIRLLVFQESDTKGKKLLFDSKSIKKVEEKPRARKHDCSSIRSHFYAPSPKGRCSTPLPRNSSNPCLDNGENGKYQFQRPGSDVKLLGEMMFGSVAISYRGSTLKVHTLRYPPQLMLTRIFILKSVKDSQLDQDSIEHNSSMVDLSSPKTIDSSTKNQSAVAHSLPMAIPNSPSRSKDSESGIAGMSGSSSSFFTPFPSPCSSVSSTSSSFSRRVLRSQTMRMDIDLGRRRSSMDSGHTTQDEPVSRRRNPKIGLAIVIGQGKDGSEEQADKFERFFFSHFSLFESHFQKLTLVVEKALTLQRRTYITPLFEGLEEFRNSICNLYLAPRIQKPIWLDLMSYPSQRSHLCQHFLKELMSELDQHNTLNTNFFVSCLLTGVLTHHLAWVPTVMPAGVTPNRAYLDKHSSTFLDTLAKSHPYNPLWAQLGDLYGSIGYPVNISKTVIVGKKAETVCRFLFILSYFIRCSEVYEKQEKREEIAMEYKRVFSFDDVAEFVLMPSDQDYESRNSHLDGCTMSDEVLAASAIGDHAEGSGYLSNTESNDLETDSHDSNNLYRSSSVKTKTRDSGIASSIEHSSDCFDHADDFDVQWEQSNSNAKLKNFKQDRRYTVGEGDYSSSSDDSKHTSPISNRKLTEIVQCLPVVNFPEKTENEISVQCVNTRNTTTKDSSVVCTHSEMPLEVKCENVVAVGRAPVRTKTLNFEALKLNKHLLKSGYVPPPNSLSKSVKLYPDLTNAVDSGDVNKIDIPMVDHSKLVLKPDVINSPVEETLSCASQANVDKDTVVDKDTNEITSGNSTPTLDKFTGDNLTPVTESLTTPKVHLHRSYSENCGYDPRLVERGNSVISDISLLSNKSTISNGSSNMDPEELPFMPTLSIGNSITPQCSHLENFGRSLLGGYSPNYLPDFALQGLPELDKSKLRSEIKLSTQNSVLDEPIASSMCIVADTDKWTVELLSSDMENRAPAVLPPSKLVSNLLKSIQELWQLKLAPDSCLMHLEDRLQEIYFKSTLLTDYLKSNCKAGIDEIQSRLAIDQSDIPLLLSVSGVHSSHIVYEHHCRTWSSNQQQQVQPSSTTEESQG